MRKVIKGRLYDTEKAALVAEWSDGYPRDFGYVCEALYRKHINFTLVPGGVNLFTPKGLKFFE